ncbi:MAG: fasciclin domain-containing protein [Saprospiraceae bacterium]|nr:fasciclin domain-containing protein [Candidatus Vicinibacter affinis]
MKSKLLLLLISGLSWLNAYNQSVVDIIVASPDHNTLEAAIGAAGLAPTLQGAGPFTVFAPTDAAFAALPPGTVEALLKDPQGALTQILLYHVVGANALSSGLTNGQFIKTINGKSVNVLINKDGVFINNAKVTVADVLADNGVVHVLDAVLLPPATVADVIVNSPIHNTLEAAAGAAGLVPTLQGAGPFTIFAPTDAAFAALPPGTVEALLKDPQGALTQILLYHAVGANALSTGLTNGQFIKTINGKSVNVLINKDGVFINNAKVTVADVLADNGVVHVLDAVLLPPATVADVIVNSPIHNTLEAAAGAAGLVPTLQGAGPFTIFAPTDDAFAALPPGTVEALLKDPQGALTQILLYHAVGANALSSGLTNGQFIKTINGKSVNVLINKDGVFINNAKVTVADVLADNGVVHVLDAVLLPPATVADVIVNSPIHNTLEAAAGAAGLVPTLQGAGPFTIFAPTDAAFAALPPGTVEALLKDPQGALTQILLYHAVGANALSSGLTNGQFIKTINGKSVNVLINKDGVFINNAKVTVADVLADNGVVHVVDAVLLPPVTVADVIVNSPIHNTLEAAAGAAGLVPTLQGAGPFTIFAPTDAAFAALPPGTVEALLKDPQGALTQILLYHAVGANALSTGLTNGQFIKTINGKSVNVLINKDGVFINNAKVTVADVLADNGVVHVVDAVLLPPVTVADVIVNSPIHNTLEAAAGAAGLVPTLQGAGPFTIFAPTDAAFAALPPGTVEALLKDPQGALTQILLYHAVGAKALSTDLTNGQLIKTINGQSVNVTINTDGVFINNAKVIVADVLADNGVVHVIDAVLTPTVSVKETVLSNMEVYPNPVLDKIYIRNGQDQKVDYNISILELSGKEIFSIKANNRESIDLDINPGIYILTIRSEEGIYTQKIVKLSNN